jgi:acetylornithine deacetylase/succinyl-diaminopimelate desuccinylase-like protein
MNETHVGRVLWTRLIFLAGVVLLTATIQPTAQVRLLVPPKLPGSQASGGGKPDTTPDTIDFSAARGEAVRILQDLIQIDTSNPPGNETKAAEYIKALFDREKIPSEIVALEPARGNVIARLRGNGRRQPLLLMGHTDVVGVERAKWSVDPFAGVVKDGYVWGRGARDNKGMVAAALEVMLLLRRHGVALDRDVIFLGEAGEEATTSVGIDFVVAKHWDKIASEFALNEGGIIDLAGNRVRYVGVATTEKVSRGIRLVARGTSGHGSMPRLDNPIVHLAAAVAKVGAAQLPIRLNETTRTFFQRLASISPPEEAYLYTRLDDSKAQDTLRRVNPEYNSMLRTSISPNIIQGGFRSNVIPAEAEATLDVRALPDEKIDDVVAWMRKLIDDPAVEVVPPAPSSRPSGTPSRLDSEMFNALEAVQKRMFPAAVTLPMMLTAATDSAQLRAKGVQAYGLTTPGSAEERTLMHGNDERVPVAGVGMFVEYMYRAVVEVAGAR